MLEKFISKVGLDRIAHFGVGAAIASFLSFMFIFSLPMADGVLRLTFWGVQIVFVVGYVAVALLAWFKELNDAAPDKWDFVASMLGVVFVHLGGNVGWLLHLGNGRDLITTPWGWAAFGAVAVAAAVLWVIWYVRFRRGR